MREFLEVSNVRFYSNQAKKHYRGLPNCKSLAITRIQRLEKQNECKIELFLRKCRQKFIWFAKSGLESRSGQGFSRPAVATVITASGIVTSHINVFAYLTSVATVITASGIVTTL